MKQIKLKVQKLPKPKSLFFSRVFTYKKRAVIFDRFSHLFLTYFHLFLTATNQFFHKVLTTVFTIHFIAIMSWASWVSVLQQHAGSDKVHSNVA